MRKEIGFLEQLTQYGLTPSSGRRLLKAIQNGRESGSKVGNEDSSTGDSGEREGLDQLYLLQEPLSFPEEKDQGKDGVIIWLNDLEKDPQYAHWPTQLNGVSSSRS